MGDTPPYMRCVLKLDTSSPGWHKTMIKVLTSVQGVSYTIDAVQGFAYVEGKIESDVLLKIMEKAGQHAELWHVDSMYQPSTSGDYLKMHGNDDHDHGHGHGNVNGDKVPDKKPTNCCMM